MKNPIHAPLLLLGLALATGAHAADPNGRFAIDGLVAGQPCSKFSEAREAAGPNGSGDRAALIAFASWTEGYLSGVNQLDTEVFDATPWQPIELTVAKLQSFCAANPDIPYFQAVMRYATVLKRDALKAESEVIEAAHNDKTTRIYKTILERVRQSLRESGFDVPSPEGTFDADFATALEAYQTENQLPVTGIPDVLTLNKLFP